MTKKHLKIGWHQLIILSIFINYIKIHTPCSNEMDRDICLSPNGDVGDWRVPTGRPEERGARPDASWNFDIAGTTYNQLRSSALIR